MPLSRPRAGCPAFTLIELLVVVAIMAVLASLGALSLRGLSGSGSLTSSGNQLVGLVNQARQNSLGRGVLTAVVLVTDSQDHPEWNNRLFGLFELSPGATAWVPAAKWATLAKGVVVDTSGTGGNFAQQQVAASSLSQPLGSLACQGAMLAPGSYAYQIFAPTGQILVNGITAPLPPTVRLVQGGANGQSLAAASKDYYDVTLNPYTGTPTVSRP